MMTDEQLWNDETEVWAAVDSDTDIPEWIDRDTTVSQLMAIEQGGCASGAYMPAVTYHTASQTMAQHGDDVLQYLQGYYGELPKPKDDESWSRIAVFYLSCAVESWAIQTLTELRELDEDA